MVALMPLLIEHRLFLSEVLGQSKNKILRDLLGGVVEIKTTFANFLDTGLNIASVQSVSSNVIEVYNTLPYRVGDNVRAQLRNY